MDGWNTFSFPFGARPIFRGELAVNMTEQAHHFCLQRFLLNGTKHRNRCGFPGDLARVLWGVNQLRAEVDSEMEGDMETSDLS